MSFKQRSGPPSWFVILLGIALVFGVYYLWAGLRGFMATGLTVAASTRQAIEGRTATAVRIQEIARNAPTPLPSFTPVPACQDFAVGVYEAIVRAEPSTSSRIVDALKEGETVCVIAALSDSPWYLIDDNRLTRRIDEVYMHRDIIYPLHPTARPTNTFTPTTTDTPTNTFTPRPRPTRRHATVTAPPPLPSATARATAPPLPASVNL